MPSFQNNSASPAPEDLIELPQCHEQIKVLVEDIHFLIIEKPAGLLSVPGRNPANRDSVLIRMQEKFSSASIVHRLDFDTSGVMVIPLNAAALSDISKQFQARSVKKTYIAVVDGILAQDSGVIDLPIAADADNRPKYKICESTGKKSVTEYQVLERNSEKNFTRVLLKPITGRSHQLRLHLAAIGHPIWGCPFYASDVVKAKSPRLLLHAHQLSFQHPVSKQWLDFICSPDF